MAYERDADEKEPFDQTNGLAPGVEGDDGGAIDPDDEETGGNLLTRAAQEFVGDDYATPQQPKGETKYSEEGAE
ncbi:MAG: hypothetical protein JWR53_1080 [Glaciihabitans sp.]|jgi:hypothetical protein|nr:hypothetical protein [Glaciihabitans sp.]